MEKWVAFPNTWLIMPSKEVMCFFQINRLLVYMVRTGSTANLSRVAFFFLVSMIGKEDQWSWGCLQGTESDKWQWLLSWVWREILGHEADEGQWKGSRVNALEVLMGLKNCWKGGNKISEKENNKVIEKVRIETGDCKGYNDWFSVWHGIDELRWERASIIAGTIKRPTVYCHWMNCLHGYYNYQDES